VFFQTFGTASAACRLEIGFGTLHATLFVAKKERGVETPRSLVGVPLYILHSARHAWLFDLCIGKGKIKPRKIKAQADLHTVAASI
jgi:hypothetical protein